MPFAYEMLIKCKNYMPFAYEMLIKSKNSLCSAQPERAGCSRQGFRFSAKSSSLDQNYRPHYFNE